MSATVVKRFNPSPFAGKVLDEIKGDAVEGYSIARLAIGDYAVVCVVLEAGDDYLTVSVGGNIRHYNLHAIGDFQLVSANPDFAPAASVPLRGEVGG